MRTDIAVVVHTCDKNKFFWGTWRYFFEKFWDWDFAAQVYFMNEEADATEYLPPSVIQVKTGMGDFSTRLINTLLSLKVKNIFYIQEDYLPTQTLDVEEIYDCFNGVQMNGLYITGDEPKTYTMLDTRSKFWHPYMVDGGVLRKLLNNTMLYNHNPAIWDREFLLDTLRRGESPWDSEQNGTMRLTKSSIVSCESDHNIAVCLDPEIKNKDFKIYMITKAWTVHSLNRGNYTARGERLIRRAGLVLPRQ